MNVETIRRVMRHLGKKTSPRKAAAAKRNAILRWRRVRESKERANGSQNVEAGK